MKSVMFSRGSWHYRLATVYGRLTISANGNYYGNICQYVRNVLMGVIATLLLSVVLSIALLPFMLTGVWFFVRFQSGIWVESIAAEVLGILLGGGIVFFVGIKLVELFLLGSREVRYHVKRLPPDNFAKSWWRSFHDKTCFTVYIGENIGEDWKPHE